MIMHRNSRITPILWLAGTLTIVVAILLGAVSPIQLSTSVLLLLLTWGGMALVHVVGWLVVVVQWGWLQKLLKKLGLLWIFDVNWFLPFYAMFTLGIGVLLVWLN